LFSLAAQVGTMVDQVDLLADAGGGFMASGSAPWPVFIHGDPALHRRRSSI
jgi:hypothetical protein